MIDISEGDPSSNDFVMEALDSMPHFNDNLQTNSILTRRIMKMKIEKGFTINKEEAESKVRTEMKVADSTMSSALSQHNPSAIGALD